MPFCIGVCMRVCVYVCVVYVLRERDVTFALQKLQVCLFVVCVVVVVCVCVVVVCVCVWMAVCGGVRHAERLFHTSVCRVPELYAGLWV